MVLATTVSLGDNAYGAELIREIEKRTGRGVTSGSLYVTLDRLEDKGMIRTKMGDPDPLRRIARALDIEPNAILVRDESI